MIMYTTRFIVWAFSLALCSLLSLCHCNKANPENKPEYLLSRIEVDSIKIYNIQGSADNFIFSPLKENAIWIVLNGKRINVDLTTGISNPLNETLGVEESAEPVFISIDPYESESFLFSDANNRIIYFSKGKKTAIPLPEKEKIAAVLFEKNRFWIGSESGLSRVDRSDFRVENMKPFRGHLVYNIIKVDDLSNQLLIDYNYVFDPETKNWHHQITDPDFSNMSFFAKDGLHIYSNLQNVIRYTDHENILRTLKGRGVPYTGQILCARHENLWTKINSYDSLIFHRYDLVKQNCDTLQTPFPEEFWYADLFNSNGVLMLSKTREGWIICEQKSKHLSYFPQKLPGNVLEMEMDSRNVYLLFKDKFMIISIAWMLSNAVQLERYYEEIMNFKFSMNQLISEEDFDVRKSLYDSIQIRFEKSGNPFIAEKFRQLMQQRFMEANDPDRESEY